MVVVSTGTEDVVVPDFVGMTVEEANEAAQIAGLEPVFVEDPDDPDPDGFVVEQDTVAGEVVPAGSEVTLQLSPATQDPWTSIKVEAGGLLKAAGLNFLPESVSEAVVIDSTVSGSAVVDDDGFWLITMSMAPLDPTIAYEMVVTGTAEDGSDYEQTFKVPAVGETVEEPVEDEGIPTWVWFVAGGILIAAIILGVVLVTNSSGGDEAAGAAVGVFSGKNLLIIFACSFMTCTSITKNTNTTSIPSTINFKPSLTKSISMRFTSLYKFTNFKIVLLVIR